MNNFLFFLAEADDEIDNEDDNLLPSRRGGYLPSYRQLLGRVTLSSRRARW